MSRNPDTPTGLLEEAPSSRRIVGEMIGARPGPCIVVMTGIHGNESSGIRAAERVLERLQDRSSALAGHFITVVGNLQALGQGVRYLDRDLNRHWTPEQVARIRALESDSAFSAEDREQRELIDVFDRVLEKASGLVYFLDLHTSSADGPPFLTVGDTLRNRRLALRFHLPIMLGLEEQVDGSLLEYLNNCGFITIGVEAGQHDDAISVEYHEASLWIALVETGALPADAVPELEASRERLRRAVEGLPPVIEVRYRHAIRTGDGFRMEPGYRNLEIVERQQTVGRDHRGPIRTPIGGCILLPLYQGKGDDGFFLGREVRPFWLSVSETLRRLRLNGLVRHLPGVRAEPSRREELVVDTRIARLYPLEIFHLLGYRKLRNEGNALRVSRRLFDLSPPEGPIRLV